MNTRNLNKPVIFCSLFIRRQNSHQQWPCSRKLLPSFSLRKVIKFKAMILVQHMWAFFSPVYTISKSLRPAVHWWSKTFCRWSALWWLECKPFFTMVFNLKTKFCRIRFLRLGLISFACVIPTPYPHAYHDLSRLVQHLPFVSGYTAKLLPAAMCWELSSSCGRLRSTLFTDVLLKI